VEKIVHVTGVEPLGDHRLRLQFEDPAYFGSVKLDEGLGTIVWPNGADIAPETLHRWVMDRTGDAST
jgi:hypothetical protein